MCFCSVLTRLHLLMFQQMIFPFKDEPITKLVGNYFKNQLIISATTKHSLKVIYLKSSADDCDNAHGDSRQEQLTLNQEKRSR